VGKPPIGHLGRETMRTRGETHLSLTVKQAGGRLCYVADGIAEAPVIRVRQGDRLTIDLTDDITDTAAIDAVRPHEPLDKPNLPVAAQPGFYPVIEGMHHPATGATNLHVHGFPVPPVLPQDEVMRTCADPAVGAPRCGHRTITYSYQVPPAMPPGLYWYHPHVHGEADAQTLMGLSGAIVVESAADDARRANGIGERVLVVRQSLGEDKPGDDTPSSAETAEHRAAPVAAPRRGAEQRRGADRHRARGAVRPARPRRPSVAQWCRGGRRRAAGRRAGPLRVSGEWPRAVAHPQRQRGRLPEPRPG
jgi:FtsP/CotA-like multicopper oxidase with cupredoxin domain